MNVGSGDAVPADFHEEKIGKFSGGLGAKPPASLCVLSPRGERTWPRIGYPFSLGQRFICADKLQHAPQNGSGLRATPFLNDKKAGSNVVEIIRGLPRPSQMLPHLPEANRVGTGQRRARGFHPLAPPSGFGRHLNQRPYIKGLRPRGLGWL